MLTEHKTQEAARRKIFARNEKNAPRKLIVNGAVAAWVGLTGLLRKSESMDHSTNGSTASMRA